MLQAYDAIKLLREQLWVVPDFVKSSKKGRTLKGRDVKSVLLMRVLMNMAHKDHNGRIQIQYSMGMNVKVCSKFYEKASAIPRKKF